MNIAIKSLYKYSGTNNLNEFSDWLKDKSGFKISEANLSRWLNDKCKMSGVYEYIINQMLKNQL